MLVEIEVADFVDASRTMYGKVADPLTVAAGRLTAALQAAGGMAGDDPGGRSWASSYDSAARSALIAEQNAVNGCYQLCTMFGQSARNYENAEVHSTTRAAHTMAAATASLPDDTRVTFATDPPTAGGGSVEFPFGWSIVASFVSVVWPTDTRTSFAPRRRRGERPRTS